MPWKKTASSWQEKKKQKVPRKTITDADYTDDIAILENAPAQAETLLHSLERAAAGIGLHVNVYKTGDISTLGGCSRKLVDKFTYRGSNVSSTEKDINTQLAKAWTANYKKSIIWKLDRTDKIKLRFFGAAVVSNTAIWMHYMDAQPGHWPSG